MRYLGIDPGGKRIGLAIGNDVTATATALEVVPYGGVAEAVRRIVQMAEEQGAGTLVLGLPLDVDGKETAACARSHKLRAALEALGWRVELQAEYLTSNEARRRAREAGLPRRAPIDHLAAQVLLEEFLGGHRCGD
ncbi:MAG TPA: Holliday junction resolvase RuvX [Acidobacteria bacterium]|nr:Holliday junction resolvase RuvX [Acidobacteriota bacterium]